MPTVAELRASAKKKGIKGYSTMKKAELEKALGVTTKPKSKSKKASAPVPLSKSKSLVKKLKDANDARRRALQAFWDVYRDYLKDIGDATEMSTQTEIVHYLYGQPLKVAGKTHKLKSPAIDEKTFQAVVELIGSTDDY